MGQFHIVNEKDILAGRTTDIYFDNTVKIMQKIMKSSTRVVADFSISDLPLNWPWAVFCGLEEVLNLMARKKIDLYAMPEGTIFKNRTSKGVLVPIMVIDGPYSEFCIYETPMLGLTCQASGIATRTARIRKLAHDKKLLSFGIRRIHPSIAHMVDRACFIGGCDSVSCVASADKLGQEPQGTMPHALSVIAGDPVEGFKAFDKYIPKGVPRIALVDTYNDEVQEALAACKSIPDLLGVRLDTPGSRRGNFVQLIQELRWKMDVRGYEKIKIYVSGGINENNIGELVEAGVDGFGIGTTLVNAPVIDIAMDIVEKDGEPVAKRGKFDSKKHVLRCPECLDFHVDFQQPQKTLQCKRCGVELKDVMKKYISNGKPIETLPEVNEIRNYVLEQLEKIEH